MLLTEYLKQIADLYLLLIIDLSMIDFKNNILRMGIYTIKIFGHKGT